MRVYSGGKESTADGDIPSRLRSFFAKERTVAAAYLFGSRVQGTARPDSDVDIAVILPAALEEEEAFSERIRLLGQLEDLLQPRQVDVVDLERVPPLLAHEVLRSSVLLCEHDPDRRIIVEAKRQAEYLDFVPRLQYYRKEVLGVEGPGTCP